MARVCRVAWQVNLGFQEVVYIPLYPFTYTHGWNTALLEIPSQVHCLLVCEVVQLFVIFCAQYLFSSTVYVSTFDKWLAWKTTTLVISFV